MTSVQWSLSPSPHISQQLNIRLDLFYGWLNVPIEILIKVTQQSRKDICQRPPTMTRANYENNK